MEGWNVTEFTEPVMWLLCVACSELGLKTSFHNILVARYGERPYPLAHLEKGTETYQKEPNGVFCKTKLA